MHQDISNAIAILRNVSAYCLRNVANMFAQCLADPNTWVCYGTINNSMRLWTTYLMCNADEYQTPEDRNNLRFEIGLFLKHHFRVTDDKLWCEELYHMILVKNPFPDENGVSFLDGIEMSTQPNVGNVIEKISRIDYVVTPDNQVVLGEEKEISDYIGKIKWYELEPPMRF